ncbi:MAG: PAS domain-containing protein [Leptolyngbyaceae cyanobacterium MO_188.B28]|nr:PAS domain-containing protein [Leptolyngbyaceae cyanobacterium MO_188.B28]
MKLYDALYDNLPCICITTDRSGLIVDLNQMGRQRLGYSPQELLGKEVISLFAAADRGSLQTYLADGSVSVEQQTIGDVSLLDKKGESLWIRLTLRLLTDDLSGEAIVFFCEDRSEVRQLEATLHNKIRQIQLIADALPGKAAYVDAQQRYRFVNKQYGEWSKSPVEEILGQTVQQFMGTSGYGEIQQYVEAALSGQTVSYKINWRFADGQERYMAVKYVPHFNNTSEVLGFFVISQDLTEYKRTETVLQQFNTDLEHQVQERTAQLQQALDFEATLKRITDKVRDSLDEHQILQAAVEELALVLSVGCCNAALYDYTRGTSTIYYEHAASIPASQGRIAQLAEFPELYQPLLQGEYFQFCSLVPNPVRGRVAMLACSIFDDQGVLGDLWLINQPDHVFGELEIRLVQQVANQCGIALRQARLYQTSQNQVEELERLNQLKDDFLSTVSHELRSPMTNIKLATQMLEIILKQAGAIGGEANNQVTRYFQILYRECQRELSLINDLLDLSRLDQETVPLMLTAIDLKTWLPSIIAPFLERAHGQQQRLQVNIPADLPKMTIDPTSLERILTELLNNACKYTPARETITLSAMATPEKVQLQVSNSGVEIAASELPHIFEKFYRIPSNDPWRYGGTGLGLALVKKLADHLGASIQVESAAGKTKFTIQFPIFCPYPDPHLSQFP